MIDTYRILNEIANKCGLLTQNQFAFQSSDNTSFRESLTINGHFHRMMLVMRWAVWVFVDSYRIHVQSKSRYAKTLNKEYSHFEINKAIEDINQFLKEIKLYKIQERIRNIDKDFITDEELINLDNYDTFNLFNKTI